MAAFDFAVFPGWTGWTVWVSETGFTGSLVAAFDCAVFPVCTGWTVWVSETGFTGSPVAAFCPTAVASPSGTFSLGCCVPVTGCVTDCVTGGVTEALLALTADGKEVDEDWLLGNVGKAPEAGWLPCAHVGRELEFDWLLDAVVGSWVTAVDWLLDAAVGLEVGWLLPLTSSPLPVFTVGSLELPVTQPVLLE